MEGIRVVTTDEMAQTEKKAYAEGASDEQFMESAGIGVAEVTAQFAQEFAIEKSVTLFVGKGNNGGDAYVAGCHLKEMGFGVTALQFYPLEECSPLCQMQCARFQEMGGSVQFVTTEEEIVFTHFGLILDGLVGTGFSGKAEGLLAAAIEEANDSKLPILAIDIPSGVNGTTGEVGTVAIHATLTIYLGLPKVGFFLQNGWDHVGELVRVDFGLDEELTQQMETKAHLVDEETVENLLPKPRRSRHKYQAGYVLAVGASPSMPGAALLATHAALRSGAGIVRLFYPEGMEAELSNAPFELIKEAWDLKDDKRIREEATRAQALLMGPGMGRTKEAKKAVHHLLSKLTLPTVLDADALYHLIDEKSPAFPDTCILTPHHQEMRRLLTPHEDLWIGTQKYADQHDVTIVLKGAPTLIFHPMTKPLIVPFGDPGMASAGTGDVLTGIIASLLAQTLPPREAATLGVYLHALAGEAAAFELTSYCMTATDLIDYLPEAFARE